MLTRLLFEPKGDGAGDVTPPAPISSTAPDPTEGFKAALKKHGDDALGFARSAYDQAETLRRENAELKGKVPKAGATILDGDDLASYQALVKLGKPDEIAAALEAGNAAVGKVAEFARRDLIGEAASAHGFAPKVLAKLAGTDLRIEVKDATRAGKDVKVAEVVTVESKDDKDVEARTALDKYAEKNWPEFLSSLKGTPVPKPAGSPPANSGQPRPNIEPGTIRRSLIR